MSKQRFDVIMCLLIAALVAACGPRHQYVTLHGIVTDSLTGRPVGGATVSELSFSKNKTVTAGDGSFTMHGVSIAEHSFLLEKPSFLKRIATLSFSGTDSLERARLWIKRAPDTAYTPFGTVDASMFLDDTLMRRKKLSKNEARRIVLATITGGKILNADLVQEDGASKWIFDVQHGRDILSIVIDAYTGEVLEMESTEEDARPPRAEREPQ